MGHILGATLHIHLLMPLPTLLQLDDPLIKPCANKVNKNWLSLMLELVALDLEREDVSALEDSEVKHFGYNLYLRSFAASFSVHRHDCVKVFLQHVRLEIRALQRVFRV